MKQCLKKTAECKPAINSTTRISFSVYPYVNVIISITHNYNNTYHCYHHNWLPSTYHWYRWIDWKFWFESFQKYSFPQGKWRSVLQGKEFEKKKKKFRKIFQNSILHLVIITTEISFPCSGHTRFLGQNDTSYLLNRVMCFSSFLFLSRRNSKHLFV